MLDIGIALDCARPAGALVSKVIVLERVPRKIGPEFVVVHNHSTLSTSLRLKMLCMCLQASTNLSVSSGLAGSP
jgi:hypothetical protein